MEKEKLLRLFALQVIWLYLHNDNVRADADSDQNTELCVNGNCPLCLEIAPFFAKCEENGEGYKFGHIMDCKKYFTCERNSEKCEKTPWGRMEHNCPEGQFFDVVGKECIASLDCPQECPPKADEKTGCKIDGTEPSKESQDCRRGVGCIPVETCPANIYETYWTSGTISCEGEDEFFDAKHGKCVKAMACPQSVLEENCDLKWDLMAETGWFRGNHSMQNFCRSWIPSLGQYSYGVLWVRKEDKKKLCSVEGANADKSEARGVVEVDKYEVLSEDNQLRQIAGYIEPDEAGKELAGYTFLGRKYFFVTCSDRVAKRERNSSSFWLKHNFFGESSDKEICGNVSPSRLMCY